MEDADGNVFEIDDDGEGNEGGPNDRAWQQDQRSSLSRKWEQPTMVVVDPVVIRPGDVAS